MIHIKIIDKKIVDTEHGLHDYFYDIEVSPEEVKGLSENELNKKFYEFLSKPQIYDWFWYLDLGNGKYQINWGYSSAD